MDPFVVATAVMIVAALILMVPKNWVRKFAGYQFATDVVMSAYIVSTYATAGAVSGLATAVMAALFLSITLRTIKYLFGFERYEIDGVDSIPELIARLLTQAAAYIRGFVLSIFRKGKVERPEPLGGEWKLHEGLWHDIKDGVTRVVSV